MNLYRYRPLTSEQNLGHRIEELSGFQFASPLTTLNDNQEGMPEVVFKKFRYGMFSHMLMNDPRPFRLAELEARIKYKETCISDIDLCLERMKELCETYCTVSFGTSWHNTCMWAHYAGQHNGIVLQFNKHEIQSLNKVRYTTDRPLATDANYLDLLITKHPDWGYEDEFRIVTKDKDRGIKLKPTGCIVGSEVSDSYRNRIKEVCMVNSIEYLEESFSGVSGNLYLYNDEEDKLYYNLRYAVESSNWSTLTSNNIYTSYGKYKYRSLADLDREYQESSKQLNTPVEIHTTLDWGVCSLQ